ncbi:MAG: hypothetical protein Q7K42_05550, partial [Candidatus Diapherotrites archaeon]|nr:hypothetical protein [Candidatus Diapherotrites archaeon]
MPLFKKPFSLAPKETHWQRAKRAGERLIGWVGGPTHRGKPIELRSGPHPNPAVRILTQEEHLQSSMKALETSPNFQKITEHMLQTRAKSLLQIRGIHYDSKS